MHIQIVFQCFHAHAYAYVTSYFFFILRLKIMNVHILFYTFTWHKIVDITFFNSESFLYFR